MVTGVAAAAEHRPIDERPVEIDPFGVPRQPLFQAAMPDLPCADQKIEVAAVRHRLRVVQQRQRRGRGGGTRKIVAPVELQALDAVRSEERLVGKEWVSTWRTRCGPYK